MPDRINFVTRHLEENELEDALEIIKEHAEMYHVFDFGQSNIDGKEYKLYFIAGQVWDDSVPMNLFTFLNGIGFAWCECHKLGGYGGFVDNEHSNMKTNLEFK